MTTAVATAPEARRPTFSLGEWVDRQTGRIMVLPAVLILLAFAIFPLIVSAYLSLSRFALAPGGFKLTFIGLLNSAADLRRAAISFPRHVQTFGAAPLGRHRADRARHRNLALQLCQVGGRHRCSGSSAG